MWKKQKLLSMGVCKYCYQKWYLNCDMKLFTRTAKFMFKISLITLSRLGMLWHLLNRKIFVINKAWTLEKRYFLNQKLGKNFNFFCMDEKFRVFLGFFSLEIPKKLTPGWSPKPLSSSQVEIFKNLLKLIPSVKASGHKHCYD